MNRWVLMATIYLNLLKTIDPGTSQIKRDIAVVEAKPLSVKISKLRLALFMFTEALRDCSFDNLRVRCQNNSFVLKQRLFGIGNGPLDCNWNGPMEKACSGVVRQWSRLKLQWTPDEGHAGSGGEVMN
ncbi:hypothetical protein CEXT_24841 [Caerostris extrusa]|uniref:Uncharacterized protein n=1 Tax=Caerostris extrusa TaxID=172846 RepID=A0AAV4UG87_CAEEX|nr:hypothetical protein CEXT_24841 [Caerostris extrusa]